MKQMNKKEQHGTKYYKHDVAPVQFEALTRFPVLQGIPVRGKLTILNDEKVYFEDNDPRQHTRNRVVYRSTHFSARITADGGFSITCHTTCDNMLKSAGKKKLIQEFLQMMSKLENESGEVEND